MKKRILLPSLCAILNAYAPTQAQTAAPAETEAMIYSTMPSRAVHRPEMALDGDDSTYFQSAYGMSQGDDFTVLLGRPIALRSLKITTGTRDGDNLLTQGYVEVSSDGKTYTRAATFNDQGVASAPTKASAPMNGQMVAALRIKINPKSGLSKLVLREITLDSPTRISLVELGPGRAFSDFSLAPDIAVWVANAEKQMRESWAETAAILYTEDFITPNKVNIVYRTGPGVTGVAAVGGGEMEVNYAWARAHPEDTGLTVHEVAHVIQSSSSGPSWLIEGIADYVRWVKWEPQNFTVRINPDKASYRDAYRTTAAFLAWCELNYDSRIVSKLNQDTRLGTYSDANWKRYTGKDVDTLWSEFLAAYKANPAGIIRAPVAPGDEPRATPVVVAGTTQAVDLKPYFSAIGITRDGANFGAEEGFDAGGAAFSGTLAGNAITAQNVRFSLGAAGEKNIVSAQKQEIALPQGKFSSLWLLGGAVEGGQRAQRFTVTYSDGTTQTLVQNLSDWYAPQEFVGENRALRMGYRNLTGGARDPRPFSLYSYGFALDATKTVRSLALPDNPNVKIAGVSLGK